MEQKRRFTIGFIGLGHMGLAIARGAATKVYVERYEIAVYDPSVRTAKLCQEESFTQLNSEKEVAENCHIVLLAVTPQHIEEVLDHLKGADIQCLLSIVTGVSIGHLQEKLGKVPVIRAMPNTPLQIGEGATALCMSENCPADDYDFVFKLFSSMGLARTLKESQLTEAVALNGSTPAYFYYVVQCLMEDAVERGIDEEAARALIVQTMIGSGKLLQENRTKPLADMIDEVCTKGGTTIEAIQSLKDQNLKNVFHEADEKCIHRAEELGNH